MPVPNVPRASWDTTVCPVSLGATPESCASVVMPRNMNSRMPPIQTSVLRALLAAG